MWAAGVGSLCPQNARKHASQAAWGKVRTRQRDTTIGTIGAMGRRQGGCPAWVVLGRRRGQPLRSVPLPGPSGDVKMMGAGASR